jgi:hypothetical protein
LPQLLSPSRWPARAYSVKTPRRRSAWENHSKKGKRPCHCFLLPAPCRHGQPARRREAEQGRPRRHQTLIEGMRLGIHLLPPEKQNDRRPCATASMQHHGKPSPGLT